MRRTAVVFVVVAAFAACADGPIAVSSVQLAMPEVAACANPPTDILAEVWQSGAENPSALAVDEVGAVSGEIVVATGLERRIVVDWFVNLDDTRVMLAQAATTLDLTRPEEAEIELSFGEADLTVTQMVDVTDDLGRVGFPLVSVRGIVVPVADLDGSCGGEREDVLVDCSNLGELCALGDPLSED